MADVHDAVSIFSVPKESTMLVPPATHRPGRRNSPASVVVEDVPSPLPNPLYAGGDFGHSSGGRPMRMPQLQVATSPTESPFGRLREGAGFRGVEVESDIEVTDLAGGPLNSSRATAAPPPRRPSLECFTSPTSRGQRMRQSLWFHAQTSNSFSAGGDDEVAAHVSRDTADHDSVGVAAATAEARTRTSPAVPSVFRFGSTSVDSSTLDRNTVRGVRGWMSPKANDADAAGVAIGSGSIKTSSPVDGIAGQLHGRHQPSSQLPSPRSAHQSQFPSSYSRTIAAAPNAPSSLGTLSRPWTWTLLAFALVAMLALVVARMCALEVRIFSFQHADGHRSVPTRIDPVLSLAIAADQLHMRAGLLRFSRSASHSAAWLWLQLGDTAARLEYGAERLNGLGSLCTPATHPARTASSASWNCSVLPFVDGSLNTTYRRDAAAHLNRSEICRPSPPLALSALYPSYAIAMQPWNLSDAPILTCPALVVGDVFTAAVPVHGLHGLSTRSDAIAMTTMGPLPSAAAVAAQFITTNPSAQTNARYVDGIWTAAKLLESELASATCVVYPLEVQLPSQRDSAQSSLKGLSFLQRQGNRFLLELGLCIGFFVLFASLMQLFFNVNKLLRFLAEAMNTIAATASGPLSNLSAVDAEMLMRIKLVFCFRGVNVGCVNDMILAVEEKQREFRAYLPRGVVAARNSHVQSSAFNLENSGRVPSPRDGFASPVLSFQAPPALSPRHHDDPPNPFALPPPSAGNQPARGTAEQPEQQVEAAVSTSQNSDSPFDPFTHVHGKSDEEEIPNLNEYMGMMVSFGLPGIATSTAVDAFHCNSRSCSVLGGGPPPPVPRGRSDSGQFAASFLSPSGGRKRTGTVHTAYENVGEFPFTTPRGSDLPPMISVLAPDTASSVASRQEPEDHPFGAFALRASSVFDVTPLVTPLDETVGGGGGSTADAMGGTKRQLSTHNQSFSELTGASNHLAHAGIRKVTFVTCHLFFGTSLGSTLMPSNLSVPSNSSGSSDMSKERLAAMEKCCAAFLHLVMTVCRDFQGVSYRITMSSVVMTFNAFEPCPFHEARGCLAALHLGQELQEHFEVGLEAQKLTGGVWWGMCVNSGAAVVGVAGTHQKMSPSIVSDALTVSQTAAKLCSVIRCHILVLEPCYHVSRTQVFCIPVDIIGHDGAQVIVFELKGRLGDFKATLGEYQVLMDGFACMAVHKFEEAERAFERCILTDHNAARLLEMTRWCRRVQGTGSAVLPKPYHRILPMWASPELLADQEELDEEVAERMAQHRQLLLSPNTQPDSDRPRLMSGLADSILRASSLRQTSVDIPSPFLASNEPWSQRTSVDYSPNSRKTSNTASLQTPLTDGRISPLLPVEVVDRKNGIWLRTDRMLGQGSFGAVYQGLTETGALVAMKVLPLNASEIRMYRTASNATLAPGQRPPLPPNLEEVLKEINLLSQLNHPNIVQYHTSAIASNFLFIMMEFMSGGTLTRMVQMFGALPSTVVRRFSKDILEGLRFLHSKQIVHRDINPNNVLLTLDGSCKLSDFGASTTNLQRRGADAVRQFRRFSEESRNSSRSNSTSTATTSPTTASLIASGMQAPPVVPGPSSALGDGKILGTPIFMAPEAARGSATSASDIWGFGVILCYCFSGTYPYPEADYADVEVFLRRLGNDDAYVPTIPRQQIAHPAAIAVIEQCLQRREELRPSAADLLMSPFLIL